MIRRSLVVSVLLGAVISMHRPGYGNDIAVTRHKNSPLSSSDAATIVSQATSVIQSNSCNVPLRLSPTDIGIFNVPITGTVDNPDEFTDVCSQPGYVHVVAQIHYCRTAQGDINGCSKLGGSCVIVVRDATDIAGPLWAHEYGHTKGLHHRVPDDPNALMNQWVTAQSRQLVKKECDAFKAGAPMQIARHNVHYRAVAFQQRLEPPEGKVDVLEFVHRRYAEGVPYEIASSYSREDARKLLRLMETPEKEKPYLPSIVTTLGMIGDPLGVEPLITFVEQGSGTLESPIFRAKTSALIALGYIINKSRDERALSYLAKGVDPSTWLDKKLEWRPPVEGKRTDLALALVKSSILGLALAGTPEAEKALGLAAKFNFAGEPEMTQESQRAVTRALALNKRIQQQGLKQYYLQNQLE